MKRLNHEEIAGQLATKGVDWIFNPPFASHFGGVWERQIRSIRRILRGLLKQQALSIENLETLFCEVEAIINSRPLTRVSNDPKDLNVLTPSHLLTLKSPVQSCMLSDKTDVYARRRWRQVQYLADMFWKRWVNKYLPELQERQKWFKASKNLRVGDIVLVIDDKLQRSSWPMGEIIQVLPDESGLVRKAMVRTVHGEYLRPVSKMCKLLESEVTE